MTRIRIKHTRFTHKHLIEKTEPSKCNICQIQMTVKHIFGECSLRNTMRRKTFKHANNFKKIIVEDNNFDSKGIFDFLREIEFLDQI